MNCSMYVTVTVGLRDRAPLGGGHGSGAGTAHGYFHTNRLQMVLLSISIAAELPLEKHSVLCYGDRVVVIVLHWERSILLV